MNILLVEDNDVDVEILKRGLRKIDAEGSLIRARDGVDALEILVNDAGKIALPNPYVILLDINMPRMNGHEFLKELRAHEALKAAKVYVFTTSASQTDIDLAHEHLANGYIVKPETSTELRDVLEALKRFWELCEHPSEEVTLKS